MRKLVLTLLTILIAGGPLWAENSYAHEKSLPDKITDFCSENSAVIKAACVLGVVGYFIYRNRQNNKKLEKLRKDRETRERQEWEEAERKRILRKNEEENERRIYIERLEEKLRKDEEEREQEKQKQIEQEELERQLKEKHDRLRKEQGEKFTLFWNSWADKLQ